MATDTGGPAFPSEQGQNPDGTWNQAYLSGATLLDYFAAEFGKPIIADLVSHCETIKELETAFKNVPGSAYSLAVLFVAEKRRRETDSPK